MQWVSLKLLRNRVTHLEVLDRDIIAFSSRKSSSNNITSRGKLKDALEELISIEIKKKIWLILPFYLRFKITFVLEPKPKNCWV